MKHALTIAGSDCSGGAGIQADLKTFAAHGVYGMSVIVSVVAENTERVISIEDISPKVICDQIDAVFTDIEVDAVKVGMLSGIEQMQDTVLVQATEHRGTVCTFVRQKYKKRGGFRNAPTPLNVRRECPS